MRQLFLKKNYTIMKYYGTVLRVPEGSNQSAWLKPPLIYKSVHPSPQLWIHTLLPPYMSLSIYSHTNCSTHQSAHPCCFLISSHPQRPRMLQNYSQERSPYPIRTSSGMHMRGSFPEPLSGFRRAE